MSSPVAGYLQGASYTAAADRLVQDATVLGLAAAPPHGFLNNGFPMFDIGNPALPGLVLSTAGGSCMVAGYTVWIPPQNITLTPAGSVARRDLIIIRVYDKESGDATDEAKLEVISSANAAVDPVIPARSLVLVAINVPPNATGFGNLTITDRRKYTAAVGGVIPTQGIANLPATSVPLGSEAWDLATGRKYRRSGTMWLPVGASGPLSYTPLWFSVTGQGNPVAQAIRGYYTLNDGVCTVAVFISAAANGGGTGPLGVTLPVRSSPLLDEQTIRAKFYTPGFGNYSGVVNIPANSIQSLPFFSENATVARIAQWSGTMNGQPGMGVPQWPGEYTIQLGSNFSMSGTYLYDTSNP